MSKVTVRQASEKIASLEPFKSYGNIEGISYNGGQVYRVYSYAALLLEVFPEMKIALVNNQRYSVTTSTHQASVNAGVSRLTNYRQPEWTILEYGTDETKSFIRQILKEKSLIPEIV